MIQTVAVLVETSNLLFFIKNKNLKIFIKSIDNIIICIYNISIKINKKEIKKSKKIFLKSIDKIKNLNYNISIINK